MNSGLLTYQNITFGYQKGISPVIEDMTYSLKEGSITTILGPNGAGKTTLLYLTLGWLKPWSGEIHLSGKPISGMSRRKMGRKIALIPQSEHNPFEYTVLEYVLLGRSPYLPPLGMPTAKDENIAFESLDKVGISHLYDHSMLGLSGGEKQLILIARALAQEPKLLLMDEPTSHLDLSNKYRLLKILKGLREGGSTILMTTHEPELAFLLSDETILMEKGRVLTSGPTNEVATNENLTRIYNVPVRIVEVEGKNQVLWI